jgi:hypothetical protein
MPISPQYLAGFFDGEGSMRLQRGFSKRSPLSIRAEVKIVNTSLMILEAIQGDYGGKTRIKRNPTPPVSHPLLVKHGRSKTIASRYSAAPK